METIVQVRRVSRRFGSLQAVQDLSFSLRKGSVTGFIGANGSGKTTTMRMMATLDFPDQGEIRIGDWDTRWHLREVRRMIGWMPDHFSVYEQITVREYLDFFARAYGWRGTSLRRKLAEVVQFVEMEPLLERQAKRLSKGEMQRLCLARTLLGDPELLILDEPAAGLDPKARVEFKQLVRLLSREGKTFFISSHILSELGEMCDHLIFIDAGRLLHEGTAESLARRTNGPTEMVKVFLTDRTDALLSWIALQPGLRVKEHLRDGLLLEMEGSGPENRADLLRRMIQQGFPVCGFQKEEQHLEHAFIDLLQDKGADRLQGVPAPAQAPLPAKRGIASP